jgi:ATP-binding cassette subfamily F protein 3
MLQLSSAGKRFGQKLLFEDVNWLITPDERTGLVGGNGTGKSTLLKVLGGIETLDYGQLTRVKGMTLGYLPQDGLALRGKTVFAECLSVFDHLYALEAEAEQITHTLSTADPKSKEYLTAADRYSDIADQLHVHDIYTLDSQVGAVLGGLGFSKEDWERKTEEFSGGWQMRIALAKLLLQKPSLLLLDEPTNHLDLESRNWLENYLHDYPNAFILISHDRYFLDVTVGKVMELWNKRMHVYHGNYEKYLTQKDERRATLMAAYKNQKDRIEALEAFAVAHQGARKDRADRGAGGRIDDSLLVPPAACVGSHGHRGLPPEQAVSDACHRWKTGGHQACARRRQLPD